MLDAYNAWKLKNTNQNDVEAVPKNIEQNDVELMPVEQPAVATSENAPDAVYYFDTAAFLVTTMNELVLFVCRNFYERRNQISFDAYSTTDFRVSPNEPVDQSILEEFLVSVLLLRDKHRVSREICKNFIVLPPANVHNC